MSSLFLGIDQSTGSKSALGIALIEPKSKTILFSASLRPRFKGMSTEQRIYDLAQQFDEIFLDIYMDCRQNKTKLVITFEQFVMRGKSGQSLAWIVGALISCIPIDDDFILILHTNNLYAKKNSTGSGKSDKEQIGAGLLEIFEGNKESIDKLKDLIHNELWDEVDAISLALAASATVQKGNTKVKLRPKKQDKVGKSNE